MLLRRNAEVVPRSRLYICGVWLCATDTLLMFAFVLPRCFQSTWHTLRNVRASASRRRKCTSALPEHCFFALLACDAILYARFIQLAHRLARDSAESIAGLGLAELVRRACGCVPGSELSPAGMALHMPLACAAPNQSVRRPFSKHAGTHAVLPTWAPRTNRLFSY
jgi:hypothetical protein